ncbi:unnamed protein product [Lampetra fluviatilis]
MHPMEPSRHEQEERLAGGACAPPPDTCSVLLGQLELLLRTVAQLAIMVAELGTILNVTPPSDAIFSMTPQPGATAAGAAATPHSDAVAAAIPQLGASANAARQPGIAAAPLAMPSGVPMCASSLGLVSGGQQLNRLPPLCPFIATRDDWLAFQDRFNAAYASVGWPMEEALWALPTCLDNRVLQALKSIPPADRASLPATYQQMAAVFEPLSSTRLEGKALDLLALE